MDFSSISGYPAVKLTLLALISLAEMSVERDTSGSSPVLISHMDPFQ